LLKNNKKMEKYLLSLFNAKIQFYSVSNFFNFKKLLFQNSKFMIMTLAREEI